MTCVPPAFHLKLYPLRSVRAITGHPLLMAHRCNRAASLTAHRRRVRHGPVLASCLSLGGAHTLVLVGRGLSHQLLGQELLEERTIHIIDHPAALIVALRSNLET